MNEMKQHGILASILYHLLPGVVNLIAILVFSHPFFATALGIEAGLSPVVGYLLGILFSLLPVQLGILLLAARQETGKLSLRNVVKFTQVSRVTDYLLLVPAFIVYFIVLFVVIAPMIQPYIVRTFFDWWPAQYNFQSLLQDPSALAGYDGIEFVFSGYILLSCISGPLVEELYFRGYLLPRMEGYAGKWAPLLNTVLFSVYHFFSPWENLIRIVASYPLVHTVWKKRDIRFGILVHVLVNTIGGILALFALLRS
jgi:hypothetical protein